MCASKKSHLFFYAIFAVESISFIMTIDIILTVIGAILMILGIVGCILPVIPGVVFNYIGILLLHFTKPVEFSWPFLIGWAVVVIAIEVLDYFIPIWGTKTFGGGKKGVIGATVGVLPGVFIIPPWGIIIFPFVGAVVGELMDEKTTKEALKAGTGSFLGFLFSTLIQLVIALVLTFFFFKEIITVYWS